MRMGDAPPGGEIGAKLVDQTTNEEAQESEERDHGKRL